MPHINATASQPAVSRIAHDGFLDILGSIFMKLNVEDLLALAQTDKVLESSLVYYFGKYSRSRLDCIFNPASLSLVYPQRKVGTADSSDYRATTVVGRTQPRYPIGKVVGLFVAGIPVKGVVVGWHREECLDTAVDGGNSGPHPAKLRKTDEFFYKILTERPIKEILQEHVVAEKKKSRTVYRTEKDDFYFKFYMKDCDEYVSSGMLGPIWQSLVCIKESAINLVYCSYRKTPVVHPYVSQFFESYDNQGEFIYHMRPLLKVLYNG